MLQNWKFLLLTFYGFNGFISDKEFPFLKNKFVKFKVLEFVLKN